MTETNGFPLVVLPSSSTLTREDADAARRMYSTMRSHRTSLVSAPMRNPANCSGVGSGAAQARLSVNRGRVSGVNLFENTSPPCMSVYGLFPLFHLDPMVSDGR